MHFSHLLESDFALTTKKHTQMTKEDSKGMKDLSTSNVRKVTFHGSLYNAYTFIAPYAGHVVEVMFRNHYNAYDMFSNRTWLSSSFVNRKERIVIF